MAITKHIFSFIFLLALTIGGCTKKKSQDPTPKEYIGPEIHCAAIQGDIEKVRSLLAHNPKKLDILRTSLRVTK